MANWKAMQNGDGGWAYSRGCSWTEPTVFALLAQSAGTPDRESFQRGVRFLNSIARPDGGWSPQPGVEESTWVTALAVLLPEVAHIDDGILALAHGGNGRGRGGMISKLESARIALAAGKPVIIANGRTPQVLERIVAGEAVGTRFAVAPQEVLR